jgi:hypothetical protein
MGFAVMSSPSLQRISKTLKELKTGNSVFVYGNHFAIQDG